MKLKLTKRDKWFLFIVGVFALLVLLLWPSKERRAKEQAVIQESLARIAVEEKLTDFVVFGYKGRHDFVVQHLHGDKQVLASLNKLKDDAQFYQDEPTVNRSEDVAAWNLRVTREITAWDAQYGYKP